MKRLIYLVLLIISIPVFVYGYGLMVSGVGMQSVGGGGCSGTLIQEYTAGTGYLGSIFGYSTYVWYAGSFTTEAGAQSAVCTVEAQIYKVASPTGNIYLYIYNDSSGPSSQVATSGTNYVDASTIPDVADGAYSSWTLSSTWTPDPSTRYYIVIYKSTYDSSNHIRWQTNVSTGTETAYSSGDGSSWTSTDATASVNFRLKD